MRLDELRPGLELGPSSWFEIPQSRIDTFADATEDRQSIHVDAELAAAGPFGVPVAHGFLTLSLVPAACYELMPVDDVVAINYGLNRVRFPAPVPAGSCIRAMVRVDAVDSIEGGAQVTLTVTFVRDGAEKPVCVAEQVFR